MHFLDNIYKIRALKMIGSVSACMHVFNAQTNESISIRYDIRKLTLIVVR